MTDAQALTLARPTRDFHTHGVSLDLRPFELPADWIAAQIRTGHGALVFGIDPAGNASS